MSITGGGGIVKYSSLRRYVAFYKLKVVKYCGVSLITWPIIAGYLDYNDVLPSTDWLNCSVATIFGVFCLFGPRRRLGMRYITCKPTKSGWRRGSDPKWHLFWMHWLGPFFLMAYFLTENPSHSSILPTYTFFAVIGFFVPLIVWRPLILRLLFGFDRRTQVFGFLK